MSAPASEETLAILRARARALAQARAPAGALEQELEVVAFTVAGESYGIESAFVREVVRLKSLAELPGLPRFLRGIVNLRGRIVSVMDIRKFFGLPDKGLSDLNKLVVVGSEAMVFAILADAIEGMRRLSPSELQPALPAPGVRRDYVRGMSGERLVVLAAERLLSDPKLLVQQTTQIPQGG
jgi:purine-binding chemotaxis protein CheW